MSNVSRLVLDHPALGAAGGSGLHAQIEAIYKKIGDNISTRILTYASLANGATATLEHDLKASFANCRFDIYTLSGSDPYDLTRVTSTSSPSLSQFTIVANGTNPTTQIDVTNNTGSTQSFAIVMIMDPLFLVEGDIKDIDITTTAPQDGQALVWDGVNSKFIPGASGDSSFKLQSVSTPNLSLKGGYLFLEVTGEELATYSGSGATSASYGVDLTLNLTTIFGSSPANATAYYLYIDKTTLGSEQTLSDTGRKLYQVTQSNFKLFTTQPSAIDPSKYIYVGMVRSATTGNVWSGSGAAFASGAKFRDNMQLSVQETSELNWIQNSRLLKNADGFSTYADAAASTPVDGTGGVPNVTLARSTSSPLLGAASLLFSKDAVNRQGEGFSVDFNIPSGWQQNRINKIGFLVDATDANFVSGDLTVFIYDITNSLLITPQSNSINKDKYSFIASWQAQSSCTQARLIVHVATTNASAYAVKFDAFEVGSGQVSQGATITSWESHTLSTAGMGAITSSVCIKRRVGSNLQMKGYFTVGTLSGSVAPSVSLPSGLNVDVSALTATRQTKFGSFKQLLSATTDLSGSTYDGVFTWATGDNTSLILVTQSSSSLYAGNVASSVLSNGAVISFDVDVPIAEWANKGVVNLIQQDNLTNWKAYTPSFAGGWGGTSGVSFFWKRVGDEMLIRGALTVGTPTGSPVYFGLPTGYSLDTSKLNGDAINALGTYECHQAMGGSIYGTGFSGVLAYDAAQGAGYLGLAKGQNGGATTKYGFYNGSAFINPSENLDFNARIPIAEWANQPSPLIGFTTVSGSNSGLMPSNLATLDDVAATRMGLKIYKHGTSYNGGNAPTLSTVVSVQDSCFIPYQMQDGSWRMKFNFFATVSSGARTSYTFTLNGVTFKNSSQFFQTVAAITGGQTVNQGQGYVNPNASTMTIEHSSLTTTLYGFSGDVQLDSKPTWAY